MLVMRMPPFEPPSAAIREARVTPRRTRSAATAAKSSCARALPARASRGRRSSPSERRGAGARQAEETDAQRREDRTNLGKTRKHQPADDTEESLEADPFEGLDQTRQGALTQRSMLLTSFLLR